MKKLNRLNAIVTVILVLAVIFQTGLSSVAAPIKTPRLEISQKFKMSGADASEDDVICEYTLKGVDGTEPLPDGSSGSYTFSVKGNGSFGMDILVPADSDTGSTSIRYTKAGVYEYTLERTGASGASAERMSEYKLDDSKYTVRMYIVYDDTTVTLGCIEVIDEKGNKPDSICYVHEKPAEEDSTQEEITTEGSTPPADSSVPAKETKVTKKPLTGDEIALVAILSVLGLSFVGIIVVLIIKKRKAK